MRPMYFHQPEDAQEPHMPSHVLSNGDWLCGARDCSGMFRAKDVETLAQQLRDQLAVLRSIDKSIA